MTTDALGLRFNQPTSEIRPADAACSFDPQTRVGEESNIPPRGGLSNDAPTGALTRYDLQSAVYGACKKLSRRQAREIVDEIIEEICLALEAGEDVKLHGFGTFSVRRKERRDILDLQGRPIAIPARKGITFRASPGFLAALKGAKGSP